MICIIKNKRQECKVTENLGYVHDVGTYAKAVEYDGKEYIVVKIGGQWRTRTAEEKLEPGGIYAGA